MVKYSKDEEALIFLSQFEFMTSSKFAQVLSYFNNPQDLFLADSDKLLGLKNIFNNNFSKIVDGLATYNEQEFLDNLESRGINVTTIISKDYPQKLLRLDNPPYVLFYVGDINLVKENSIAIVGTRAPSNYGKIVTEKYAKTLAENNICVVSGLATGVDKIAHEATLKAKGKTIAVMGGGFNHIFPSANINLAR